MSFSDIKYLFLCLIADFLSFSCYTVCIFVCLVTIFFAWLSLSSIVIRCTSNESLSFFRKLLLRFYGEFVLFFIKIFLRFYQQFLYTFPDQIWLFFFTFLNIV